MKKKTHLQTELVALQSLAGDASNILAWPERGIGVAFDGAGNPMTVNLAKAVAVTPQNQHRLIPDGNRVNATLVKRSDAIKTFLPILEKNIAAAVDDTDPVAMTDKPAAPVPVQRPVVIPEATGTHGA